MFLNVELLTKNIISITNRFNTDLSGERYVREPLKHQTSHQTDKSTVTATFPLVTCLFKITFSIHTSIHSATFERD